MSMNDMFSGKPKPPTLDEMIACAKRELAMRKNVYPRWVAAGKMKQHSADNELRVMQGIIDCLTKLAELPRGLEQMEGAHQKWASRIPYDR